MSEQIQRNKLFPGTSCWSERAIQSSCKVFYDGCMKWPGVYCYLLWVRCQSNKKVLLQGHLYKSFVYYVTIWSLFILINTQREQLRIICNFSLPLLKLLKHIIILHKNIAVAQHKTLKKKQFLGKPQRKQPNVQLTWLQIYKDCMCKHCSWKSRSGGRRGLECTNSCLHILVVITCHSFLKCLLQRLANKSYIFQTVTPSPT